MTQEKPAETSAQSTEAKPEVDKVTNLEKQLQQLMERQNRQEALISRKDAENKTLRDKLESHDEQVALNQAMLGYLSKKEGRSIEDLETDVRSDKIDLVGEYKRAVKETQDARKKEEFNRGIAELQGAVVEKGYTENDPEYWEVFGRVSGKNLDDALRRVSQLPDKTKKEEPPKVDTEKVVEEQVRKRLEEMGQLQTEKTQPSGGSGKVWTESEVQKMDWREYKKNFPTYEDFLAALSDGRIK